MAGKITKNFRLHNARQFIEQFDEESPSHVYFFIGKSTKWDDESIPPEPLDTIEDIDYKTWEDILALKKVLPSDVSFGINRVDWSENTVYAEYTSDTEFHNNSFYVVTEDYNVYKCIDNNNGAQSKTKPFGTLLTPIRTSDGYSWKYMYSISASDALKFTTNRYIPVKTLTVDDGSRQWQVQQEARNGSIESIQLTNPGINYVETTGTLAAGGSNNIRLSADASGANDAYNNCSIYIFGGTGIGQKRIIIDYIGASKTAVLDTPFDVNVDATSAYIVSPNVVITGDGTGATGYSRVVAGRISAVNLLTTGQNYTYADVTFTSTSGSLGLGTGYVSPVGGHGKDAVEELYGHKVIMNIKLRGNEANTFISKNDFRVVGIIADPSEANSTPATDTTYDQTTVLTLTSETLQFTNDEVVSTNTGNLTANVVEYNGDRTIRVVGNRKNFTLGQIITGAVSGATATISAIKTPALKKYTGKILYIENRSPTTRSDQQEEDIKIVILF